MLSARPCVPADIDAVVAIVRGLPEYFTADVPDKVRSEAAAPGTWVLSEPDDDGMAGFAITKRMNGAAAEIRWMAVAPGRRRQGLGTALLGDVLSRLSADGVRVVEVKTLDSSAGYPPYEATRAFWERNGFVHIDTIDPLPEWEPGSPAAIYVAALLPTR
jgi:GNAT superfamily N-acetyltransferase